MSEKFSFTQGHGIRVGSVELLEFTYYAGCPAIMNPPDRAHPGEPPEIEITKAVIEDDDGNEHLATDEELERLNEDEGFFVEAEMEVGEYLSDREMAIDEDRHEADKEERQMLSGVLRAYDDPPIFESEI